MADRSPETRMLQVILVFLGLGILVFLILLVPPVAVWRALGIILGGWSL